MIERVQFQKFKALKDVSLDLSRLTVLVGPNGSGKTSVLEGMKYLDNACECNPDVVFGGVPDISGLFCGGTFDFMTLCWIADGETIRVAAGPATLMSSQGRSFDECLGPCHRIGAVDGVKVGVGCSSEVFPLLIRLGMEALLRLEARNISAPSYSAESVPTAKADGSGLPSLLAHLASTEPETLDRILASLSEIVPNVRALRFPRAAVKRTETEVITVDGKPFTHRAEKEYWGNSIEFDMENAAGIPASMVSEGTLLVLGLLTVILGPSRPRLLLLDDIDRALHPKAQGDLIALLRKLMAKFPEMQIVATSHSPYLLDHLQPEEVRLTTLKDDGTVAAGRLDEHPEFEKWRETMTPGEFWSMVGESWLVDVRAGDVPAGEKG